MSCTKNKFRFPSQDSYNVVASKGKKLRLGFLSLKIMPAPDDCNRFCFIVKKKNGNAVFRNKCRRILRSVFFKEAKNFKLPFWIMAVVEMSKVNANWEALRADAEMVAGKYVD
jgi:ribonuclease P protein component